jgi:hypothetical protein
MPRCGRPARRAVSRPVCADETNLALSVDRKPLGTSKRASHPAGPVPAVAPHGPRCSADACRSAIARPILRVCSGKCSLFCGICGLAAPAMMEARTCMPCCRSRSQPGRWIGILLKRMRRGGICRRRRGRRAVSVHRSSVEQASARRRSRDVRTGRPADLPK